MIRRTARFLAISLTFSLALANTAAAGQWGTGFAPVGFSGAVSDVQVSGANLLACGLFTSNGDTYTPSIAAWSGYSAPLPSKPTSVAIVGGELYVGSYYSYRDGPTLRRGYLARWNGSGWTLLITDGIVHDLAVFDGEL